MAKRPRIHPGRDASPGVTKRPEDKRGGDANAHYDRDEAQDGSYQLSFDHWYKNVLFQRDHYEYQTHR